ncbi:hypothetical protein BRAS3843_970032 [Bradyrhizobium sp. STM 3843]|nr:hypothetical protein BRAS3843_970032 [Bradyrhizobium sp. STM 3843]
MSSAESHTIGVVPALSRDPEPHGAVMRAVLWLQHAQTTVGGVYGSRLKAGTTVEIAALTTHRLTAHHPRCLWK